MNRREYILIYKHQITLRNGHTVLFQIKSSLRREVPVYIQYRKLWYYTVLHIWKTRVHPILLEGARNVHKITCQGWNQVRWLSGRVVLRIYQWSSFIDEHVHNLKSPFSHGFWSQSNSASPSVNDVLPDSFWIDVKNEIHAPYLQ
jgi:hypothetical protein